MRTVWKITLLAVVLVGIGVASTFLFRAVQRVDARNLTGVVLVDDADINKQRPLAGVHVDAGDDLTTTTDSEGLFHLKLPASSVISGVTLDLQHPDFAPKHITLPVDGQLYVLRMKPVSGGVLQPSREIPIADVRVRFTESVRTSSDTGGALKSFDVVNKGNVPCEGREPCSPDGKWKAAIGGVSLDAGEGNEFREARVSCIAGPCPFARIEKDGFSQGGRNVSVTVRDWSDTVSFVIEAEVTHTTMSDLVRLSYPLIFGRGMNFSVPPSGEGPSIEATVEGMDIVYPLGPDLSIEWATCTLQVGKDQTNNYRCDLKPGYRFQ